MTPPMYLRKMETWWYVEISMAYFHQIFSGVRTHQAVCNWHLPFILRAHICYLTIFMTDCCRVWGLGLGDFFFSSLVFDYPGSSPVLLWFFLGSLCLSLPSTTDISFHVSKPLLVHFPCHLCLREGLVFVDVSWR